jgi:hypothetical protein
VGKEKIAFTPRSEISVCWMDLESAEMSDALLQAS